MCVTTPAPQVDPHTPSAIRPVLLRCRSGATPNSASTMTYGDGLSTSEGSEHVGWRARPLRFRSLQELGRHRCKVCVAPAIYSTK